MNNPTYYINVLENIGRAGEVPAASFANGGNVAGTNSPGIGVSTGVTNLEQSLPNWTLLDQDGVARVPQDGQAIGNAASALFPGITVGDNAETTGDGVYAGAGILGFAVLSSLATGWIADSTP